MGTVGKVAIAGGVVVAGFVGYKLIQQQAALTERKRTLLEIENAIKPKSTLEKIVGAIGGIGGGLVATATGAGGAVAGVEGIVGQFKTLFGK